MSLRTPLGKVLGRGSAHDGVHHWWSQRVSAVALVPLTVWLLWSLTQLPIGDYAAVADWVAEGWHPVLLALAVLAMCWHSMLGVQVIVEDYVHQQVIKSSSLLLNQFLHVLLAAGGVYAILRVAQQAP